ncbi:amino acid adenylation domain-containing protein [Streptomyces sp. NPDC001137]|uniref:amino acid adenylation domain-containing protein n=1 Tax=Streptomyces sp. NPDC001137 TaxID=3154378 RepID=UPI0033303645
MNDTPYVTLPTAWRSRGGSPSTGSETVLPYGDLLGALDACAALVGTRLYAVLSAAHVKVLSTLTEERVLRTEVVRSPSSVDDLRVDPSASATWRELTAQVSRASRGTAASDDSVSRGVLHPERVLFAVDADASRYATERFAAGPYGLLVTVRDDNLVLRADGAAMTAHRLERLASMYRRVLEEMAAGADGDARGAYLPEAELRRVSEWSTGPVIDRGSVTVVDLFQDQVARTPDATAVRVSGKCLTYRELDRRSLRIARHLIGLGAGRQAPVGVCLRRSADLLPALLGVWRAGAPYLPLDADLPVERLRRQIDISQCRMVVTSSEHAPLLGASDELVLLDEQREEIDALPATPIPLRTGPTHPAYVMYTSGSTGMPKGVMVHHGGLANYLLWAAEEYAARGEGGSPYFTSISFDLGIPSLFAPLLTGQPVVLLPDPLPTEDFGAALSARAPYSFVKLTPGHLNLLSVDLDASQARDLAGLVIAAGDAFPGALAQRWNDLAGPDGTPVATEYGPTEITVGNSGQRIVDPDVAGLTPLGAPIPNTSMYVLTERLEPVPEGVPGEVYVGGAGVSCGYLGDSALTAERFLPDPWGPAGARLYRTGDRARWRSGELEFLGRVDHQVKIRGHRVEPGEVRETLRRHPDVAEAVVVSYERPPRPTRLAAFVVTVPGRVLDARRLRSALAEELPSYMIPSDIVAIDDVPLTTNGKVDIRLLADMV